MGATLDKFGDGEESTLFALLDSMPWAGVTSILVMVLVAIFFVSGADAASIVMGTLSERGTIEPTRKTVIFWGVATGGVAAAMLLAGFAEGDASAALTSLQNVTIVSALPFVIVMVLMCVALVRDLQQDPLIKRAELGQQIVEQAVIEGVTEHGHDELALVVTEATADEDGTQVLKVKPAGDTSDPSGKA